MTLSFFVVSHPVAKYPPNEVSRTSGRKRGAPRRRGGDFIEIALPKPEPVSVATAPRRRACTDAVVRCANLQSLHFYTAIISHDGEGPSPQIAKYPNGQMQS